MVGAGGEISFNLGIIDYPGSGFTSLFVLSRSTSDLSISLSK